MAMSRWLFIKVPNVGDPNCITKVKHEQTNEGKTNKINKKEKHIFKEQILNRAIKKTNLPTKTITRTKSSTDFTRNYGKPRANASEVNNERKKYTQYANCWIQALVE